MGQFCFLFFRGKGKNQALGQQLTANTTVLYSYKVQVKKWTKEEDYKYVLLIVCEMYKWLAYIYTGMFWCFNEQKHKTRKTPHQQKTKNERGNTSNALFMVLLLYCCYHSGRACKVTVSPTLGVQRANSKNVSKQQYRILQATTTKTPLDSRKPGCNEPRISCCTAS